MLAMQYNLMERVRKSLAAPTPVKLESNSQEAPLGRNQDHTR